MALVLNLLLMLALNLACISHHPPTVAAQWHPLSGVRSVAVLDMVLTLPARSSVANATQAAPLHRLATNCGEKCRLDAAGEAAAHGKVNRPAQGRLLVAKRHLSGPVFGQSVVLLLQHDHNGSLGVILNHRTGVDLVEALPDLGPMQGPAKLYFGGPVGVEYMVYLVRGYAPPQGTAHVFEDVYFGGDTDSLRGIFEGGQDDRRIRVFGGVAGWAPGQLDGELARGDWFVVEASAEIMFSTDPEKLWGFFIDKLQRPANLI